MNKLSVYLWLGLICLVLSGCTARTKDTAQVKLPQHSTSSEVENNTEVSEERQVIPASIAILPFTNITPEKEASPLLRQVIHSQLAGQNFSVMNPADVDKRLPLGPFDHTRMASYLGVDEVLVGEVINFERFFAGIYSEIRVGIKLSLYDDNGDEVWTGQYKVTRPAGVVPKTAWERLLKAATLSMNLGDENLLAAADELGRTVANELQQQYYAEDSAGPRIESVIHDKAGQWLRQSDVIEVGVKGEAGLRAFVTIGDLLRSELQEEEPGVYIGKISVPSDWNETRVPITGVLQDKEGNTNTLLSITGLVNFDNLAPPAVSDLVGSQTETTLKLAWQDAAAAAIYKVTQINDGGEQVLQQSSDTFVNLNLDSKAFSKSTYQVVALDKAGNASEPKVLTLTTYVSELGKQSFVSGPLHGDYSGILSLTANSSPYKVKGAVVFTEDSELYVEPGVVLNFEPGATIEMEGEAFFRGLEQNIQIQAIGKQARREPYLILSNNKPTQISGVKITDAGIGILVKSGQPVLEAIEFIGSRFTALSIEGDANVTLRSCVIDGSNTAGIVVTDYAKLNMSDCSLLNNFPYHIQNASSFEVIAVGNKWQPAPSKTSILGKVKTK